MDTKMREERKEKRRNLSRKERLHVLPWPRPKFFNRGTKKIKKLNK